ncbi:YdeI/OmpD-associated family protein [Flagellimonas sp. DF-77]|uniref:YdeI/OmpD-associated family protein n=1 Tax=Flagellimonas algarum TaxID=3230298 RepID=UPI0033998235
MDTAEKIEAYYGKPDPFQEALTVLRDIALKTEAEESFKWNFPVYTIYNKNVFGICRFKSHFGVWFFNGVFLSDPKGVLENAQEGKTKAMRHWKFETPQAIDEQGVLHYMQEAIENQKLGKTIKPARSKVAEVELPALLAEALAKYPALKANFEGLSPYKQKEYCEYIATAKQDKTKARRMEKILPMIEDGIGLNDAYRNC